MTRWGTDRELNLLKYYAEQAKYGIIEIGVLEGGTTRYLCASSTVPVYAIDPIVKDSMEDIIGNEQSILNAIALYQPRCTFIKDYSANIAKTFDKKFDFIFIDGSHLYEDVKLDYELWYPKMEQGGIMCFHDSAPVETGGFQGWPGPTQVCDEIFLSGVMKLIARVDTIRTFQK